MARWSDEVKTVVRVKAYDCDLFLGNLFKSKMPSAKDEEVIEIEVLREENKEIKQELSTLQDKFSKLQEYVRELEGKMTSKKDSSSGDEQTDEPSQFQVAIKLLEKVLMEGEMRALNKPRCRRKVKTQQEQCERLTKKVEDLQQQNMTLSSIIVSKGKYQSLNHCRKNHLLPASLISNANFNSLSLPNTLVKTKAHCDTDNSATSKNAADCWYNNNQEKTTCSSFKSSRVRIGKCSRLLPNNSSSSLPQSNSSKKRSLHHQTSADRCWYDIIKSLQSGDSSCANIQNGIADNNNTSSDNSSVDTERNVDSQNRMLRSTEDCVSTSSSGDDFHALTFSSSKNSQQRQQKYQQDHLQQQRQQQQQGEKSTSCFPSNSASSNFNTPFNSNVDVSLVTSSQYLNSKTLSANKGRMKDINLDFTPSHKPYQNTVVANFTVNSNPKVNNNNNNINNNNNNKSNDNLSNPSNKDSSHSPNDQKTISEAEGKSTEGIVKDEGYSTMSSDVQSEAKDSIAVVTISTVVEERGRSFDGESESKEETPTGTLKTRSASFETLKVENNNNKKNLSVGGVSVNAEVIDQSQPEYSDGLRVVYDDEDNNSDILYVPIAEENDRYLMRHSFNFPFPNEPIELQRCSSDSYLYKLFVRFPTCSNIASKRLSTNNNALQSLPLKKQNHNNIYNTYLRRAFKKESLKRECMKLFSRPLIPNTNNVNNENRISSSFNYDYLSHLFPPSSSHPRILSPSYSHAEMEDWSLDLSGEDITTPGGTEPSAAESGAPSHHHSQPSIQETTLDLEEDHHDFLWNGATYFKAVDNDLSWPFAKDQAKSWDLNLVGNKQCRSMISPKSGCSDQPAMWSSSEHLSCCSDIASKCSTDIENFCEQLCNLPELKRISICSSENGGNESLPSNTKLSEIDSTEDNSELTDDINVETVFTRDFYRLVKFESTKSLTASSKSLAASEGFLTLEKLKGFESLHNNKTLASVLGFIAEQQKYCKDREVMDENASFGPVNQIDDVENREASFHLRVSEDSQTNNEMENPSSKRSIQDNVLTSSESCGELNTEFISSFSNSQQPMVPPPKPKRSTSLNLGNRGGSSYRSRGTLPPLPSTYSPPPIPSRSTSRSTLPHHHVFSRPFCQKSTLNIPEEPFPPPPPEDSYVEPYHAIPMAPPPPKVPPHRIPILPKRSSSVTCHKSSFNSPPVPKRITSRALPIPPPVVAPLRSSSLETTNAEKKSPGKFNRPKSLLKESASNTSKVQGRQKRGSCGDLGPICRNSATLMLELQKMAKAEEEEKAKNSTVLHSPEATSPGTEVGLGTGWVRIEPSSDLGDPQTRANILDTMLQSSEGCSSETDEDIAKQLQHSELLRAVQRNRRKRKASRHSGSDPMRVFSGASNSQRPTILGRHSLFNRYGEEEENALKEFQFLESFPSQSDVFGSCGGDQSRSCVPSHYLDRNEDSSLRSPPPHFPPTSLTRPLPTDLKYLRSSEPCPDELFYPISSSATQSLDEDSVLKKSSSSLPSPSENKNNKFAPLSRTFENLSTSIKNGFHKNTNLRKMSEPSTDGNIKQSFHSFERIANMQSDDLNDNNKISKSNVPSTRLGKTNCYSDLLNKKSNISGNRQSTVESRNIYGRNVINKSNLAVKIEKYNLVKENCNGTQNMDSKTNGEESKLVDTRSISNVKEIIEKLNNKNNSSGKSIPYSGSSNNNYELNSFSNRNLKPSFISTKCSLPSVSAPTSNRTSDSFLNAETSTKTSLTANDNSSIISKKNCQSKRTPKLPGSNLIKRLTSTSLQTKDASASLPPKGGSSMRTAKDRQNVTSRLPSRAIGATGKGLRSPRLPRLKLRSSRGDPLSSFSDKGMCDSGSSENSDKGGGRISISDSCAEIFSLGESGDEVFLKHS